MRTRLLEVFFALLLIAAGPAPAQVDVWTHHNDNARSGANLGESQLSTSSVNVDTFGKLWSYVVDDDIYTQPLVIHNVSIPGKGVHNVVYVATMNDSVYAFDADSNVGSNAQPLWHTSFINPGAGITPVPTSDVSSSGNIRNPGNVGVLGTPVIDRATGTMYLVARTKENGSYVQRLHALDIGSGSEKFGGPVSIQAIVSGTGSDNVGGQISFNPKTQNQRPGLALANGNVYIAWASHDDSPPYHGWVIAYNATTLAQVGAFCDTPDGSQAGIWQAGQAPSVDLAGNVYAMTGNGDFNGTRNFGESIVKLDPSVSTVLDWFAPDNWQTLNDGDLDLGSAGVLLIPGTNRVIGGGKSGLLFMLDTGNMGHVQTGNGQIVQNFQVTSGGHIHGSPVYWNGPNGPMIYVWGEQDFLKAFAYNGSTFGTVPATKSTFTAPVGMPGGFLSVSANGSTPGSGIVWAALPYSADAELAVVSGVLRAFDASDLSQELWNSRLLTARDDVGNFAKDVPPTVANGHVYVASFSKQLHVYGLLSSAPPDSGGQLTLAGTASTADVDLTAMGTSDWAHWPGYDQKASGDAQISDVFPLGTTPIPYSDDPRTLSWSDGAPNATGSLQSGIYVTGTDTGFLITTPADATTRTLTLYVGGFGSRGELFAHLSDGSAADVDDTAFSAGGHYGVVYTLTYHAASANQQLTTQWTLFAGANNLDLQGAALSVGGGPAPPPAPTGVSASDGTSGNSVTVVWNASTGATGYSVYRSTVLGTQGSLLGPATLTSFTDTTPTPGTTYYYGVSATGPGGTSGLSAQDSGYAALPPLAPTGVSASDGTSTTNVTVTWNASANASTYTLYRSTTLGTQGMAIGGGSALTQTDTTPVPGTTYYYGVIATGPGGPSPLSAQDSGYARVPGPPGTLTGSVSASSAAVDLTTIGSADWAHWPGYDHKLSGAMQISDLTTLGGSALSYSDDQRTMTWGDGTPNVVGSSTGGVYIAGSGKGFSLTVPADTTARTLKLYVGGWSSNGKLVAHLSDGSAADYVDTSQSGASQYDAVYTLTYGAGTAGKQLNVQWLQLPGSGNVNLQAAALIAGTGPAPPPVPTGVSASDGTSGNSVIISWNVSTGATSYSVYRSTALGTRGSLLGPATATSFTDTTPTPGTTYYYGVTATGAGGTSVLSVQDSGYAATPPPAPTNVQASDGTSTTSVTVSWTASINAQGYTIFRSTTAGIQGSSLGSTSGTTFLDTSPVPGTTYYYGVKAMGVGGTSALSAQDSGFALLSGPTGTLSGSVVSSSAAVNLSKMGTDWAHWPGYEHKAPGFISNGPVMKISDATAIGASWSIYGNDPRTFSWNDGTNQTRGSSAQGLFITGAGTGFTFNVPADTMVRTLRVYVGGWNSSGKLIAHLSDGSAVDFVDTSQSGAGQYDAVYTLVYSAAAANQQLTVQWIQLGASGNVTLQGAAVR